MPKGQSDWVDGKSRGHKSDAESLLRVVTERLIPPELPVSANLRTWIPYLLNHRGLY